jgi:hypothetical protein
MGQPYYRDQVVTIGPPHGSLPSGHREAAAPETFD